MEGRETTSCFSRRNCMVQEFIGGGGGGGGGGVGTATVHRSFSQMKLKTRLRNQLADENLVYLMRIAIEGPDLSAVNFDEVLDILKQKNR